MSGESPKKTGRGYARNLKAGQFQPMIDSWDLHLRAERKSAKTIRTYLEAAQWMAAEYLMPTGFTDWDQVEARHVQEWIITLLGRYSDCYANNQFRALQQFFKWHATEDPDEPRANPMTNLKPPKRAAGSGLGHQRDDSRISLFWTILPAWRCCSVTRAQPNRKASQDRQHQEVHRAGHHLARAGSAGRQRARVARRGGQRDHRRRPRRAHPVETAAAHSGNQLLHARLGRPHRPADVGQWRSGSQVRYPREL